MVTLPLMARAASGTTGDDRDREEAARLIQLVAPRRGPADTTLKRIQRAAIALKWNESRVRHIWFGEATVIHAWQMDQLREFGDS